MEKTNDKGVGAVVFLIKPNDPKRAAQHTTDFGPKTMEPIITGICIVVEFKGPNVINPSGVKASKSKIAKNIAVNVNFSCYS